MAEFSLSSVFSDPKKLETLSRFLLSFGQGTLAAGQRGSSILGGLGAGFAQGGAGLSQFLQQQKIEEMRALQAKALKQQIDMKTEEAARRGRLAEAAKLYTTGRQEDLGIGQYGRPVAPGSPEARAAIAAEAPTLAIQMDARRKQAEESKRRFEVQTNLQRQRIAQSSTTNALLRQQRQQAILRKMAEARARSTRANAIRLFGADPSKWPNSVLASVAEGSDNFANLAANLSNRRERFEYTKENNEKLFKFRKRQFETQLSEKQNKLRAAMGPDGEVGFYTEREIRSNKGIKPISGQATPSRIMGRLLTQMEQGKPLTKEQDAVFRAAQRQEGLKELLNSEVAKLKQGGTGLTSQTPIRPDAGTVMKKGFWYLDPTDGQVKQWDGTRLK